MSIQEQKAIKEKHYYQAIRFFDNAKDLLKKAEKRGDHYDDLKYVKMACGTAYLGALEAINGYLILRKGYTKKQLPKNIDFYRWEVGKLDKKLLRHLNNAYSILHIAGYYGELSSVNVVNDGLEEAMAVIKKLKITIN